MKLIVQVCDTVTNVQNVKWNNDKYHNTRIVESFLFISPILPSNGCSIAVLNLTDHVCGDINIPYSSGPWTVFGNKFSVLKVHLKLIQKHKVNFGGCHYLKVKKHHKTL